MTETQFVVLVFYLLPTAAAVVRRHMNALPIALVNVVLGWTVLGWAAALVWSLTDNVEERT